LPAAAASAVVAGLPVPGAERAIAEGMWQEVLAGAFAKAARFDQPASGHRAERYSA